MARPLSCVVLAAGQGTRMRSDLPKVMHALSDQPLVTYPVAAALAVGARPVVVVTGHGCALVEGYLSSRFGKRVRFARQKEQLGTAHAVACARRALSGFDGTILILYGDVPLVPGDLLRRLRQEAARPGSGPLAMVTCRVDDPTGYGRILRDADGCIVAVREHRDCNAQERRIAEMNPGLYLADASFLFEALRRVGRSNVQKEFYLTDMVELAAGAGPVRWVEARFDDVMGINDRSELARAEAIQQSRTRLALMRSGVTMALPDTVWVGAQVKISPDVVLGPGVVLRGRTRVGAGSCIDAGAVLTDATIGASADVGACSVIVGRRVPAGRVVPPGSVIL